MEKTLSQNEIDSLINAISNGTMETDELIRQEEKKRVRKYDFRRPNKFSKNHINTLRSIYDNYARTLTNKFSNYFRAKVDIEVESIEQISYGEFIRSIPSKTLMGVFSIKPFKSLMIVEINPRFGFQAVDLLCGGEFHRDIKLREFTEIEISILKNVLNIVMQTNKEPWDDIAEIEPEMDGIVTNPQLNRVFPYEEAMALITFNMEINDEQSLMNFCIPYRAFEGQIEKLQTNHYNNTENMVNGFRYKSDIERIINKGKVDVSIELGKTQIMVEDFMDLRCGDVIQLDTRIGQAMKLYVEECEHLFVQPGLFNKKLAVQVVDYTGKEVE